MFVTVVPAASNSIAGRAQYNAVTITQTFFDEKRQCISKCYKSTSGYATWFSAGGAIRIAHYNVIDDVITQKL